MEKKYLRRLLITADDFGYSSGRNAAIVECYRQKAISRTSLLINGVQAEEAARMATKHNIPTGLHMNLTEGLPISPPHLLPSLLSPDTQAFVGKFVFRRLLKDGRIRLHEVRLEMLAQLQRFELLLGRPPSHVDGHQHVHVLPGICEVFGELCGHMSTRLPYEPLCEAYHWLESPRREFYTSVNRQCEQAGQVFRKYGMKFPDSFVGLTTLGRDLTYKHSTRQILRAFDRVEQELSNASTSGASKNGFHCVKDKSKSTNHELIPDQNEASCDHLTIPITCELMVHPGYRTQVDNSMSQSELSILAGCGTGPDDFDQSSDRDHEFNVITGRLMRDWIREENIEIVSELDS